LSSAPTTDVSDLLVAGLPKVQGATITYLAPLELYKIQKPYFSQLPCGTTLARTNLVESDHLVEVCDIGGREDVFELDETGFQFMHLPTNISEWTDESVQSEYLPATSAWLKDYFKCEKVFIYNYNVRRISHNLIRCIASLTPTSFEPTTRQNQGTAHGEVPYSESTAVSKRNSTPSLESNPPFLIRPKSPDNTPESCAKRLEFQFPTEAAAIKSGRYRYVE
jgi:hypothetical protein